MKKEGGMCFITQHIIKQHLSWKNWLSFWVKQSSVLNIGMAKLYMMGRFMLKSHLIIIPF